MTELREAVRSILNEYRISQKLTLDYLEVFKSKTSFDVNLYGEFVKVFSHEKRYYLFDEEGFFFIGNIDNCDLMRTVSNDIKTFGLVILALKHFKNDDYLSNLIEVYETEFCKEFLYLLGYYSVKTEDGTSFPLYDFIYASMKGDCSNAN